MLSILSGSLMSVVDRMFITRLDINLISAVASIFLLSSIFAYGVAGITSITGVLAGVYNGREAFDKASSALWQMIYFSIGLIPLTVILAIYGKKLFIIEQFKGSEAYFQITIYSLFLAPMFVALDSFCAAIGKTKIILYSVLLSNLINVILDPILIFGYPGCLYEFGY